MWFSCTQCQALFTVAWTFRGRGWCWPPPPSTVVSMEEQREWGLRGEKTNLWRKSRTKTKREMVTLGDIWLNNLLPTLLLQIISYFSSFLLYYLNIFFFWCGMQNLKCLYLNSTGPSQAQVSQVQIGQIEMCILDPVLLN